MSDESHFEPIWGLPGLLPAGERILWQGAPRWQSLARRAFRLGPLGAYFGALLLWDAVSVMRDGLSPAQAASALFVPVVLAGAACASLLALAYLSARSTVYTVTTRRVAIRTGIAFSVTINLPFRQIDSVSLKTFGDGTGDIPLGLARGERVGYFTCWPSVRPWRYTRTEPMLRAIPQAAAVGELLAGAIARAPLAATASSARGSGVLPNAMVA